MTTIQPFRIAVPQADLDDLHHRLARTRWPDELPDAGWDYGIPLARARGLADRWLHAYDWRKAEAELNGHPQFTTEIDGQRVHFLHVRAADPDALPLLLTHGWPGSVVEFLDVIGPLSAHFHLVIPSIPGFGFSGPTRERGWGVDRIARAWAELMRRLGYRRYGVQGGDWGAAISRAVAVHAPDEVAAVHLSYLPTPAPPGWTGELDARDAARLARIRGYLADQPGARVLQRQAPQTIGYALADSPVAQLAWIADRFADWGDPVDTVGDDRLLTDVMLYWVTSTGASAARLYRETGAAPAAFPAQPVGVAAYANDITQPIRAFAEASLPVVHWFESARGGHFPALEVPEVFAADVREFFTAHA